MSCLFFFRSPAGVRRRGWMMHVIQSIGKSTASYMLLPNCVRSSSILSIHLFLFPSSTSFYPRGACAGISRRRVSVFLCVCLSHAGILSQELIRRWDSERELFAAISHVHQNTKKRTYFV